MTKPIAAEDLPCLMAAATERAEQAPTPPAEPRRRRVQSLSVVIPAKNESAGLLALLTELGAVLEAQEGLQYEVLLIDDGSSDDTPDVGRSAGARVISHPESLGNGAAVKRGIREAVMDWVLALRRDFDIPHTAAELGVEAVRLDDLSEMAAQDPTAPTNPVPAGVAEMRAMYEAAMTGEVG